MLNEACETIVEFERLMYKKEFHQVMNLMDTYIRNINKYWSKNMKIAEDNSNADLRFQVLVNAFHKIRTAAVLMHPIAPEGTEMIADYLNIGEAFWNWDHIFETVYFFMPEPAAHKLKFLEPRVDFYKKHPYQLKYSDISAD